MPARSNDFQATVYFVQTHLASDATVTESAQLRDRITGEMREVDVLITGHMGGRLIQIGIECRDRNRKDCVSWVEEMRAKHDDLPTDQLVLVSRSGFSASAGRLPDTTRRGRPGGGVHPDGRLSAAAATSDQAKDR
ncbi:hypothetical protein ACGFIV_05450 [Sphaerisporangium sp. NPDC049003]|uniref:hypothetical protein n=1 Tax=Sphaerisporangium sp. NPDC049003 TaxID=3364517 RepID=UPI0037193690